MAISTTERLDPSPFGSALALPADSDPALSASIPAKEQVKAAVLAWFRSNLARSRAIIAPHHMIWDISRRLYSGKWSSDTTTESVNLNQMYRPFLGECIDFAIAAEMAALMPDAQTMDFINVDSDWPGMEEDARKGEALLRKKIRVMKTDSAASFWEAMMQLKQDHRVCGNMLAVVGYEDFTGGLLDADPTLMESDISLHGPAVTMIPPRNWFPMSITADSVARCGHFIYSPLMESEVDGVPYVDAAALRRAVGARPVRRIESEYYASGAPEADTYLAGDGPGDSGWRRFVYLGPLPWHDLAVALGHGEDWDKDEVLGALAAAFDFDPAEAKKRQFWYGDFVDDGAFLNTFRPYDTDLPEGLSPLLHARYRGVNGSLIGLGIYDSNSPYERQYNELNRLICQLARWAGDPPVVVNPGLIDEDWLAEHMDMAGGSGEPGKIESFLEPGEMILLKSGMQISNQTDPLHLLTMNAPQVMEQMRLEMDRLELIMRGNTQVTTDYMGQSNARTATQSMNNMSQSKTMEGHQNRQSENGWFGELLQRCYVVARQVIEMRGQSFLLPVSSDEKDLALHVVPAGAIRSLSYFTVSVNGSSAPSSRIYQIQQLQQLFGLIVSAMANPQVAMQLGDVDLREMLKSIFESMQLRNKQRYFKKADNLDATIANVTALLGQQGIAALSPASQQAVLGMTQNTIQQNPAHFPQYQRSPGAPAQKASGSGSMKDGSRVGAGLGNSLPGVAPLGGPMVDINQGPATGWGN